MALEEATVVIEPNELQELKKAMTRRYDAKAVRFGSQWPELAGVETYEAEQSFALLAVPRADDVVLDVGTGRRGRYLSRLGLSTARSVGVDISFYTAAAVRNHFRKEFATVANVVVASAESLPFCAAEFSLIVCSQVFEYYPLSHVGSMLREFRRVLCSSGRALVDFPDSSDPRVWTLKLAEEADGVSFFVYKLAEITDMIEASGFKTRSQTKCDVEIQFALVPLR